LPPTKRADEKPDLLGSDFDSSTGDSPRGGDRLREELAALSASSQALGDQRRGLKKARSTLEQERSRWKSEMKAVGKNGDPAARGVLLQVKAELDRRVEALNKEVREVKDASVFLEERSRQVQALLAAGGEGLVDTLEFGAKTMPATAASTIRQRWAGYLTTSGMGAQTTGMQHWKRVKDKREKMMSMAAFQSQWRSRFEDDVAASSFRTRR